jgi:phosphoglycerate dehydrogenase-like enzyme
VATHVWIPAATSPEHVALLSGGIELHVLPSDATGSGTLGPGQFVVAGFQRRHLPSLLPRISDVKVVQAMSAGVEDLVGKMPAGAVLCDGAGIHDIPMAEWIVMAMLAMYRRLPEEVLSQQAARWQRPEAGSMSDLEGANVLIVGYGSIGRALEARLSPFGVNIVRVGRHARAGVHGSADLPALLPEADVVVILLPLTPSTEGFVDAQFIGRMRPGALLVNPSRGRIVVTAALREALAARHIRAALDVTDPEPLPDGDDLWTMPDVLITPHIGGAVRAMQDRAWGLVARQLRKFLNGEPLDNVVSDGY